MLIDLNVRNFTLVNQLDLSFESGMTAITGETGAGKSIILDALSLTLGDRADFSRIRKGAGRAEVCAQFDVGGSQEAQQWLSEQQLDSKGDCILRRTLAASGKSSAWINGQIVTLNQLRDLAEMLISIHSQHEHQALTKVSHHRYLLDQYANHSDLLHQAASTYENWFAASEQLALVETQCSEGRERLDLLGFQLEELNKLNIGTNEYAELEEEQQRLANAESILSSLASLIALLEDAEDSNLNRGLQQSLILLERVPAKSAALQDAEALLKSSAIQIEEAAGAIRREANTTELDPERLALVEDRLSQIFHLARKHRIKPEDLAEFGRELQAEFDQINDPESAIENARQLEAKSLEAFRAAAKSLSESRAAAAARLEDEVNSHFEPLSMAGAGIHFEINFDPTTIQNRWGSDSIALEVRTNPGQNFGPISKIASGGELSRISLAIQVVTARSGQTPTLIFDEVDVGIGGATADTVGELLKKLGQRAQIICITHLAQVACKADQQLLVSKETSLDSAESQIRQLDDHERIEEIARMLGSSKITERSRENAKEMLELSNV